MDRFTRPKGYRLMPGCWNCSHVFAVRHYEDDTDYFCTFGASFKPKCRSVAMGGDVIFHFFETLEEAEECGEFTEKWANASRAWDEWSEGRHVDIQGICPNYKMELFCCYQTRTGDNNGREIGCGANLDKGVFSFCQFKSLREAMYSDFVKCLVEKRRPLEEEAKYGEDL